MVQEAKLSENFGLFTRPIIIFYPDPRKMNLSTNSIGFSYTDWRNGFLRVTLIAASVLGLAALIPGVTTAAAPIYIAVYIGLYLALLLVTILNFPYSIKAGIFVALFFLLGLSGLLETGIWGDSRLFMLGAITMASLLFSWKAGWVVTGITMLSYFISGWLVLSGTMPITSLEVSQGDIGIGQVELHRYCFSPF